MKSLILKKSFAVAFALAAVYIILSALGVAGISAASGVFYRMFVIANLLYSAVLVFTHAISLGDRDALFTGALGLGTLAVNEVYSFAYIYILHGSPIDITVGNYSRNCAALFFIVAVLFLVLPPMKLEKALRVVVSVFSSAAAMLIIFAIIVGNSDMLYYSALTIVCLCVLLSVYLLCQSFKIKQLGTAKAFSCSIIALSILDTVNRILIIFRPGLYLSDIIHSLYPLVYLWIGFGLINLRKGEGGDGCG